MGKAVQCSHCGSYYNGTIYSNCPYCENGGKSGDNVGKTSPKENKQNVMAGFFKKMEKKPVSAERPQHSAATTTPFWKMSDDKVADEKPIVKEEVNEEANVSVIPETIPLEEAKGREERLERMPVEKVAPVGNRSEVGSLSSALVKSGRTVGKYISSNSGEAIMPVVGWLVAVKGSCMGQDFRLKSGRNKIGRSYDMDVKLLNDESVSRNSAAVIIFDSKNREFSIMPGETDSLCYVDGKALYGNERVILKGFEKIEFGDQNLNEYIFVPFCGENFSWKDNEKKKD